MGSVIDYIECPNCKTEAMSDFYYKTGEEYINCNNCGYHYSATIINRDKNLNELIDSDWKIEELKNPFGAYRIKTYGFAANQCGSLENETQYNEFKKNIEEDVEIEYCSVSRFIDNKIVEELLINNKPKNEN
jgi:Zn ribbon nucleic-acid-binding protein